MWNLGYCDRIMVTFSFVGQQC